MSIAIKHTKNAMNKTKSFSHSLSLRLSRSHACAMERIFCVCSMLPISFFRFNLWRQWDLASMAFAPVVNFRYGCNMRSSFTWFPSSFYSAISMQSNIWPKEERTGNRIVTKKRPHSMSTTMKTNRCISRQKRSCKFSESFWFDSNMKFNSQYSEWCLSMLGSKE